MWDQKKLRAYVPLLALLALLAFQGWTFYIRQQTAACDDTSRGTRSHYLAVIKACDMAVDWGRARGEAHVNRGIARIRVGQNGQAIEDFDEALRLNPENVAAFFNRAIAHGNAGNAELEIKDLDRAIQLRPDWVEPWMVRGWTYVQMNQSDKAIADYQAALKLEPKRDDVHRGLAWALMTKDRNKAIAAAERATAMGPKAGANHFVRGMLLRQVGRYQDAVASLDRAIALLPREDRNGAYYERSQAQFQLKHYDQAAADISMMEVQGTDPYLYYMRCWYRGAGSQQLREALADCDEAIAGNPRNAGAFDARGLVRYKLGQHQGAVDDLNTALKLDKNLDTSLYLRGLARRKLGEDAAGSADIAAAIDNRPSVVRDFAEMGVTQ